MISDTKRNVIFELKAADVALSQGVLQWARFWFQVVHIHLEGQLMHELVLSDFVYVKAELSNALIDIGVVLGRNFGCIRNFTTTFHSENCNKDLVGERSRHVLHVSIAKREDEQLFEAWILDILVGFRVHAAASELHLY